MNVESFSDFDYKSRAGESPGESRKGLWYSWANNDNNIFLVYNWELGSHGRIIPALKREIQFHFIR